MPLCGHADATSTPTKLYITMEEKKRKTLQTMYRNACNNYLEAFAEKHDFDVRDCDWVGNEPGGIATVGDYYVDMQTIIHDIDSDAPEEEFVKWYDYQMSCAEAELTSCNFQSWLRGCPRHPDETFERLSRLRKEVEEARQRLVLAVEEEKNRMF